MNGKKRKHEDLQTNQPDFWSIDLYIIVKSKKQTNQLYSLQKFVYIAWFLV